MLKAVIISDLRVASCVSNIGNLFSGLYKRRSTVRRIRHQQTTAGTGEQGGFEAMESLEARIASLKRR